ncbi:MAG: carbonic anhydrase, partial [Thermoanaerobaculia bacterium]
SMSRRVLLRQACCSPLGLAALVAPLVAHPAEGHKTNLTSEQALERLRKGNADFLADHPHETPQAGRARRLEIARGQAPFAVLLGCSDSRVPPEQLFDVGLGELFIVRNAGNTIDTAALGSIQYGVLVLGAPLVVVLGHERCGAVEAALAVVQSNATFPGSIGQMIEPIIPAVLRAASNDPTARGEKLLDAAVRENVRRTVQRLRTSEPSLLEPLRTGKLKVVGARYDLDEGRVDFSVT